MLKLFKKISRISIVQNISLLTLGTVLSMAISLLFEPLLKRLYEPEDFGKLSLFLKLFNTILYIYDEYDKWLENLDTIGQKIMRELKI